MTDMSRYGLLCITFAIVGGCSGAQISLDHFSEDYGQAPPVPEAGGSGLPGFGVVFEPPTDDFTMPNRLPELVTVYREKLVAMGHVFPGDLAQQYADSEIASLKRQYSGDETALRAELTRRLRSKVARPGSSKDLTQKGPIYPVDPSDTQTEQGRVQ